MKLARCVVEGQTVVAMVEGDELVVIEGNDPVSILTASEPPQVTGARIPVREASLLAPVVPRRNIMCVGWNYLPHFEEGSLVHGGRELPDRPTFFTKTTTTVIGPYDTIEHHGDITSELDFEIELGVVIGSEARDLDEATALDVIAGYMVVNDVSARDLQKAHGGQWYKGKSLDRTCPMGPWIVSADEVADPQDLDISLTLNGETMQASNTRHMIFPIARLLSELSQGLTLLPGDVFLTGTPEGVGFSRTPPVFLQPGDVVEGTVAGIGSIRNVVD